MKHRVESNVWFGESGSDADEKKAKVAGACGYDGRDLYFQVPAYVQAGQR